MAGFENMPAVEVPDKKQSSLPEDQAVMSRRKFLAGASAAALSLATPEVLAASEK